MLFIMGINKFHSHNKNLTKIKVSICRNVIEKYIFIELHILIYDKFWISVKKCELWVYHCTSFGYKDHTQADDDPSLHYAE